MKLLLDTHALLWLWQGDARLPVATRDAIEDETAMVYVSVASIWEIAIKVGKGKLAIDRKLMVGMRSGAAFQPFEELPIDRDHALEAGLLERLHGDPFDRLLIAQAKLENLTLVSKEKLFESYGVSRMWG